MSQEVQIRFQVRCSAKRGTTGGSDGWVSDENDKLWATKQKLTWSFSRILRKSRVEYEDNFGFPARQNRGRALAIELVLARLTKKDGRTCSNEQDRNSPGASRT